MESKSIKRTEAESRTVVTRDGEVGEMGRCWSMGTKLQLCKMSKSRDLVYSMLTIVYDTILNAGNLLREYISGAVIIHTN